MDVTNWMLKEGETLADRRLPPWSGWTYDVLTVTRQQQLAIETAVRKVTERGHYEIKAIEYGVGYRGTLALRVEAGLPRDEGTMASLMCRPRILLFIGPRGGLSTYDKRGKRHEGWKALIYGVDR
jgi:hypothetical protein